MKKATAARLAKLRGKDLLGAYLEACGEESKTSSARRLGVDLQRFNQYQRGERPIPPDRCATMRRVVLLYLFGQEQAEALAALLEYRRAPFGDFGNMDEARCSGLDIL